MDQFKYKYKINVSDITYGPTDEELDKLVATVFAKELIDRGYRRVSNAYCRVARIDREDWLTVLARDRHCSVADFYKVDGTGIGNNHRDYFCRCYSKDILTVHPSILRLIPSY